MIFINTPSIAQVRKVFTAIVYRLSQKVNHFFPQMFCLISHCSIRDDRPWHNDVINTTSVRVVESFHNFILCLYLLRIVAKENYIFWEKNVIMYNLD